MEDWALITGASTGIGRELAEVMADKGFNLILVARNLERLKIAADQLRAVHKVQTRLLPIDLAAPDAALKVWQAAQDLPVSVLVNNAGFGAFGPFAASDLPNQTDMLQVNMTCLMQLTHRFVQPMLARKEGRILNVASTAAFQPGPNFSTYYATKAFVFSFSYALADELAGSGVTVTTLCPGLTRTEFQKRANLHEGGWWIMSARSVAEAGYEGMIRGKRVVIPGMFNRVGAFLARRAPLRLASAVVRRIHQRSGA